MLTVILQNPLIYYALLALGLFGCMHLFLSVKADIGSLERRLRRRLEEAESRIETLGATTSGHEKRLVEWTSRCKFVEDTVALLAPTVPQGQSLNINRRTLVLRLAKRGDHSDQIAAELGVPKNEVDLLLKIHRAVVQIG